MTFSKETKTAIINSQNGYCRGKDCLEKIHSVHHKTRNDSYARKKYPLMINSVINGVGLCFSCHKDRSHDFRITEKEAEMIENFLRNLTEGVF